VLRRWCAELADALGVADPSIEVAAGESLKHAFTGVLLRATATRRVVCLIDALDQFERTTAGTHVTWLPEAWPDNARVIATATPGTESQSLTRRLGVESLPLPSLDERDVESIARVVAGRRRAELRPELISSLSDKRRADGMSAAGNPLWLELALEEVLLLDADDFIRAKREFRGTTSDRLHALRMEVAAVLPPDVEGLYEFLLRHAEELHGDLWAREFANLIAASRGGWRESDLRQLLPARTGQEWSQLRFAALRRGFRAHLRQRGKEEQWDFAHAQMRVAVTRKNFRDVDVAQVLHAAIATYLETLPVDDTLRQGELMYHLLRSGDLTRAGRHYASDLAGAALTAATRTLATEIFEHADADGGGVNALLTAGGLTDAEVAALCSRCVFELNEELRDRASLEQLMPTLEAAERCLSRLAAANPGNAQWQHDLSVSYARIGDVRFARGELSLAREAFERSLTIRQSLADLDVRNGDLWFGVAGCHNRLGDVLIHQGSLPDADGAFRHALTILESLAAAYPSNVLYLHDLAVAHERMGVQTMVRGNLERAHDAFQRALTIREQLVTIEPSNVGLQRHLAVSCTKNGEIWLAIRDLSRARASFGRARLLLERLTEEDPGNVAWQRDLAVAFIKMGEVLTAQGDVANALYEYRRALAITEPLLAHDPDRAACQSDFAVIQTKIGNILSAQGDFAAARDALERALALGVSLAQTDPGNAKQQQDLAINYGGLGTVLGALGDLNGACAAFGQALAIGQRLAAADPSNAEWQRNLAVTYHRLGTATAESDSAGAAVHFSHCLAILADMQRRGMHIDDALAHVIGELERMGIGPDDRPQGELAALRPVDVPAPHPAADADRAAKLNIEYQRDLASWMALPWWRRRGKKPTPPTGI
jgi:tetratricopeptide (TPR) repeat protein